MKKIALVLVAALVLLLLVPVAANAGRPAYNLFPAGAKITVTVGAPIGTDAYPVTFTWTNTSPRPSGGYAIRVSGKLYHSDEVWTDYPLNTVTINCPSGNYTVVVDARGQVSGPTFDSLKKNFSVP